MAQIKTLIINNKTIYFNYIQGQWWIALNPICDALDVDWVRAYKNIQDDEILGPALSNQTMQVGLRTL